MVFCQTNEQELMTSVKMALMSTGREYWDEFTKVGMSDEYRVYSLLQLLLFMISLLFTLSFIALPLPLQLLLIRRTK